MNYNDQIKADRKAAALARKAERAAGLPTEIDERKALFPQTETMTTKTRVASILRRLEGRIANLRTLGRGFNDAHLFLLEALAANYTNEELLAKYQGQTAMIWALDSKIMDFFGLTETIIEGMQDDEASANGAPFGAWFIDPSEAPMVKEYINQLVTDYKAAA